MYSALLPTPPTEIRYKSLIKGEMLFCQGDLADAIFVVKSGRVRLMRHLADGNPVALYVAQGGQTFSEAALFSETYHCDAIADVDSEIEIHPKQSLIQALDTDAKASRAFMAHLARQVIALRSRLEIRNIRSAEQRVLQFIRLQVDETDQQVVFQRPLKDIAADLGLTHEAVYRALAKLEKSAKISRQGRIIRLLKCVE